MTRRPKIQNSNSPSKKNNGIYFTQDNEDAILGYVASNDMAERNRLYNTLIQPAFNEMVDKIVYTYKFNNLPNIEDLRNECKTWLVTVLDKYKVSKGSKAFSYFSVITKNWFIHKVKKNKSNKDTPLHELSKQQEEEYAIYGEDFSLKEDNAEFMNFFFEKEFDEWQDDIDTDVEQKVYDAIAMLFERIDDIQIFNKKAIYLYMREITGLNTKQVVAGLKKFRRNYKDLKHEWDNGKI